MKPHIVLYGRNADTAMFRPLMFGAGDPTPCANIINATVFWDRSAEDGTALLARAQSIFPTWEFDVRRTD